MISTQTKIVLTVLASLGIYTAVRAAQASKQRANSPLPPAGLDIGGTVLRAPPITPAQAQMAGLIAARFKAAGYSDAVAAAAVVNAWAESTLNPRAVSRSGKAVGLFQLHENGAGYGMSVAQRQNPDMNIGRILVEVNSRYGRRFREAAAQGASLAELIRLFTVDIERPGDAEADARRRIQMAEVWWGTAVSARNIRLPAEWR